MARKKSKRKTSKFTPFSKKNIIYARAEAYIFSLILIFLVLLDKDVSSISGLLTLSWTGYKLVQSLYIWMCKHEHLMDKKIEMKKLELDTEALEAELEELKNQDFEMEDY